MSYQYHADSKRVFLRDWWKCILIVNAFFLNKTFGIKSDFISFNVTIRGAFVLNDPFTSNFLTTFRQLNEIPNLILIHLFQFIMHVINPLVESILSMVSESEPGSLSIPKSIFDLVDKPHNWIAYCFLLWDVLNTISCGSTIIGSSVTTSL